MTRLGPTNWSKLMAVNYCKKSDWKNSTITEIVGFLTGEISFNEINVKRSISVAF